MYKSFGYDSLQHNFRLARHQVGDFGLHISLIRSFSWGNNFPPESPFFPGKPLAYHYFFDLLVGLLEKLGIRIDIAFNGLSALFFTGLLYGIYKLPQVIFKKNRLLGIVSVILFIFHSNLTFIDFFKNKKFSFTTIGDLWHLPNYLHMGPFDGSIISIFFTLNVYLNQRHLIVALAISVWILYFLFPKIANEKRISHRNIVLFGILIGMLSRVHVLTFFALSSVLFLLLFFFKRFRLIPIIFIPVLLIFAFHARDILTSNMNNIFFNPGFLSQKPLSLQSFIVFWWANLGITFFLLPLAVFYSNAKQKIFFLSILPLFIIGNTLQLSSRIDHNHSLFNLFFIFGNFYIAFLLVSFLSKGFKKRILFVVLLFFLTIPGVIDLMAIKNDFQYILPDAPSNKFMSWIKNNTKKQSIFLSRPEILDPVTLSGRYNYLGHDYYLSVMGYNFQKRQSRAKSYFEAQSTSILEDMEKDGINYIAIPKMPVVDFTYKVDTDFLNKNLKKVYQDKKVNVYQL